MKMLKEMAAIFDVLHEGILIIDNEAQIIYGNQSYCDFLKMKREDIINRPLREIRPGARLPDVLQSKKPILNAPRQEDEDIYFVNMYPIT